MPVSVAQFSDVINAEKNIRRFLSPAPLIRSYRLEKELGLKNGRQVWLKDYGWTPVGSFKVMGALNWVANNLESLAERPIAAHSSGNFASGIAFAGQQFGKRVIIVMPDSAPRTKFELTQSFGAEIRTYDISRDHETGERDRMTSQIANEEKALQASPYDDNFVIAGNGVGGLEIARELKSANRRLSHFVCQVSGGGLMAGHALSIADGFPEANIIGVEPETANDFCQSLEQGQRVRIDHPASICDGLLSYDVGEHNWPILSRHVSNAVAIPDHETCEAMKWMYENHGIKVEPSGAITVAAMLRGHLNLDGEGDIVCVISGRNVDEQAFQDWIEI